MLVNVHKLVCQNIRGLLSTGHSEHWTISLEKAAMQSAPQIQLRAFIRVGLWKKRIDHRNGGDIVVQIKMESTKLSGAWVLLEDCRKALKSLLERGNQKIRQDLGNWQRIWTVTDKSTAKLKLMHKNSMFALDHPKFDAGAFGLVICVHKH